MNIDWNNFTPWTSLFGGALLGLSSAFFILVNGRVLGISGILGGLLPVKVGDVGWRMAFLSGMLAAPWIYRFCAPEGFMQVSTIDTDLPIIMVAGLFVGLGTRYGSGCTSGHGVCGLSRLSPRSFVATMAFMGAGFFMVFVVRHIF